MSTATSSASSASSASSTSKGPSLQEWMLTQTQDRLKKVKEEIVELVEQNDVAGVHARAAEGEVRDITLQFLGAEEKAANAEEETARLRAEQNDLVAQIERSETHLREAEEEAKHAKDALAEEVKLKSMQVAALANKETDECPICFSEYNRRYAPRCHEPMRPSHVHGMRKCCI